VAGGAGRRWLDDVLSLPGAEAPTPARAVSLLTAADLAWMRGDYAVADAHYAEAEPLARRLGDGWILTSMLDGKGMLAQQRGDYASARALWLEALDIARASGNAPSEAMFLIQLGRLDIFECNYANGRPVCERGLAMARQLGDAWLVWGGLHALELAAVAERELSAARALSRESMSLPAAPNMLLGMEIVSGLIALETGEYAHSSEHLRQALKLATASEDPLATAQVVEYVGALASSVGQAEVALRLGGAAESAREKLDVAASRLIECLPHLPLLRALRNRWLLPLLESVGTDIARRWWSDGRALSLVEAVAVAESWQLPLVASAGDESRATEQVRLLTPRQQEVAVLVGQGLTNRQIAERLVVSERAAAAHVENILNKLGVGSRTQIAVWVSERGLLVRSVD
jgi:non-specific serine/threonine protein kinase